MFTGYLLYFVTYIYFNNLLFLFASLFSRPKFPRYYQIRCDFRLVRPVASVNMQISRLRRMDFPHFPRGTSRLFAGGNFYDDAVRRRVWRTSGRRVRSFTSGLAGNPTEILHRMRLMRNVSTARISINAQPSRRGGDLTPKGGWLPSHNQHRLWGNFRTMKNPAYTRTRVTYGR